LAVGSKTIQSIS